MDLRLRTSGWFGLRGAIAGLLIISTSVLTTPKLSRSDSTIVSADVVNTGIVSSNATPLLIFNTVASEDAFGGFDRQGRPRSRSSGGARGACADQLVALLPGIDALAGSEEGCSLQSASAPSLTLDQTPTLWFYVPMSDRAHRVAEFVWVDENQHAVSIEQLVLPAASGIISVQLSQPLAINQSYQWVFSILENQRNPSQNPAVEGVLRRIEADANLEMALQNAITQRERVDLFAQNGVWHNALSELVNLCRRTPNHPTVTRDWTSFLNSVGLVEIADAPLLNCCTHPLP